MKLLLLIFCIVWYLLFINDMCVASEGIIYCVCIVVTIIPYCASCAIALSQQLFFL